MNALVLRLTRTKDADAVVDWLLDDDRIITTYVAHIQGTKAYPNGIELMNVYEVEISQRPNQTMGRLHSAYSIERFGQIIEDLSAYACACAALEAITNVCPKESTVIDLFSTLLSVFAVMNTANELSATVLAWFECFLFHQLGAMPNLEICAQCARPLQKSEWFQQELGFLCPECANRMNNLPAYVLEAIRRLRYQTIRTTVQNALAKNDEQQRRKILEPVLKFLAAVMCDNSPIRHLKAHRFMGEVVFGDSQWLGSRG
ncbi:MAG: DNA repair protein RecO [Proteobacteria bacterium]|nr:DNA repair protein RecO [Pseudomonadota bacterium]